MMSAFQELDSYLKQFSDPSGYWVDEGLHIAADILKESTPADWAALDAAWRTREEIWQGLCAESLAEAERTRAIPLLVAMIAEATDNVALAAADSLRAQVPGGKPTPVPQPVRERIRALAEKFSAEPQGRALPGLLESLGE